MGLTSGTLLLLVAGTATTAPLLVLLLWSRVRGPGALRAAQRLVTISMAQCLAIAFVFVAVNDNYQFFTSWQDLLGRPSTGVAVSLTGGTLADGPTGAVTVYRGSSRTSTDGGLLINETVRGERSGVTAQVLVHLPAGYASSHRAYPVVELLTGWHGTPFLWIRSLHVLDAIRAEQQAGALDQVITVMPTVNVGQGRDVECTNVPRGTQAESWLADDMRNFTLSQFRALPFRRSWALMGYSTGGYCATKLLLHHPAWYATGLSLSGYFDAVHDHSTGDLWGGSRQLRNENSPLWLITHRPAPAVDLLVFASRQDTSSYPSSLRFLHAARAPMQTFALVIGRGGHNFSSLRRALPQMLDWLGSHLVSGKGVDGRTA